MKHDSPSYCGVALLSLGVLAGGSVAGGQPFFTEVTLEAGITHLHRISTRVDEATWMAGGGVAEDFNGDGWVDLYVLESSLGVNHLYINQTNGTFVDEALVRGAALDGDYFGATAADYDNDGDVDIFLTRRGSVPAFLINDGEGFFEVDTSMIPLIFGSVMSASWGDVNNDGLLDVMFGEWDSVGDNLMIYRNTGSGFESYDFRVAPFRDQFLFSPRFADVNNDRLTDLLVVCDFGNSQLYLNTGEGIFERVTDANGTGSDQNGMGAAVGDYDNDGDLDWFVSSIWDDSGTVEGNWGTTGNRLYRNLGDGHFSDVTFEARVQDGNWGWGSGFGDFDNDGLLDIYHVNGWPEARFPSVPAKFNNQPARLFMNSGDGTFQERAAAAGAGNTGQGRGLIIFDYDNDGDLDLFIGNNQELILSPPARLPGKPALLRNDTPRVNGWLRVGLAGTPPLHRHGIGSRVYARAGATTQMRELNASSGFLAHGPGRLAHFGFGDTAVIDEVRAEWVSGDATVLRDVEANQAISMSSPSAVVGKRVYEVAELVMATGAAVEPLGTPRDWLVDGVVYSDPFLNRFSAPGRKDLELRVYEQGSGRLARVEILRVDIVGFSVTPSLISESGLLELAWNSIPGFSYQVESCTNIVNPVWLELGEPIAGGAEGHTRVVLEPAGHGAFYRVQAR